MKSRKSSFIPDSLYDVNASSSRMDSEFLSKSPSGGQHKLQDLSALCSKQTVAKIAEMRRQINGETADAE